MFLPLPYALFPQRAGIDSRFECPCLWQMSRSWLTASSGLVKPAGEEGYRDTQGWLAWLWRYPGELSWLVTANCLFSGIYSIFLLCQCHLFEDQMLLISIFCSARRSKNLLLLQESNAQAWIYRCLLFTLRRKFVTFKGAGEHMVLFFSTKNGTLFWRQWGKQAWVYILGIVNLCTRFGGNLVPFIKI